MVPVCPSLLPYRAGQGVDIRAVPKGFWGIGCSEVPYGLRGGGARHAPPEKLRHLIVCTVYLVFPYSLLDSCSIYKICIFQWHPGGRVTDTQNTPGAALNMAGNISYQIKENCYQILK